MLSGADLLALGFDLAIENGGADIQLSGRALALAFVFEGFELGEAADFRRDPSRVINRWQRLRSAAVTGAISVHPLPRL
jgi:hypothetical protein